MALGSPGAVADPGGHPAVAWPIGIRHALHRRGRSARRRARRRAGGREPTSRATPRSPSTWRASSTTCARCRIDPVVVRQNWLKAYDFVTDRAAVTLNEYARDNDPFAKRRPRDRRRRGHQRGARLGQLVPGALAGAHLRGRRRSRTRKRLTGLFSIVHHARRAPSSRCARTRSASTCTPSTGRRTSAAGEPK